MNHRKANRCGFTAALILFFAAFWAPYVYPWGPIAHRATARFAEERLTARALAAVHELLGPGTNIEDAAIWADAQREIRGSERWHYVNVPISAASYDAKYCPAAGCVVSKISEFAAVLRDPRSGKAEKRRALKFLLHLITDLHQPLHVGDNGDRGGNLLQVRFFNAGTNLHNVWDSRIMERHTKNKQVWLWDMTFVANPVKAAEWAKGTPEDWAGETLAEAKKAYCLPGTRKLIPAGTGLGEQYYRFALPIVLKQLAKAGIRLAYLLNELFRQLPDRPRLQGLELLFEGTMTARGGDIGRSIEASAPPGIRRRETALRP